MGALPGVFQAFLVLVILMGIWSVIGINYVHNDLCDFIFTVRELELWNFFEV